MKRRTPNKGSWNEWLATFELGDREYVEVSLENYSAQMRTINATNRRPEILKGRVFSTKLFTTVSAGNLGEVRYLICVERIV